ncbi:MAG TPA: hypothetical protein VLA83_03775 [Candidatus Binatia bacterium]|nr:hypothetical protein [Candidatus Binatia bacterium]
MPANSAYWIAWNQAQARDTANAHGYANIGFAPPLMSIRGKPFTATRVWTEELKLPGGESPEGNVRTWSAELTIARDSRGRIHTEMAFQGGPNSSPVKLDVYIYDPVAHTVYRYFTTPDHTLPAKPEARLTHLQLMRELIQPIQSTEDQKMAATPERDPEYADNKAGQSKALWKQPVSSPEPEKAAPVAPPDFGGKEVKQNGETAPQVKDGEALASTLPEQNSLAIPLADDLGEKNINGIRAMGFRQVVVYGKSEQEFLIQDEWFSPEYAMNVAYSSLRSNPHMKTSYELIAIVDGEPDPSLFRVPAGYVVVEQPRIQMKASSAK